MGTVSRWELPNFGFASGQTESVTKQTGQAWSEGDLVTFNSITNAWALTTDEACLGVSTADYDSGVTAATIRWLPVGRIPCSQLNPREYQGINGAVPLGQVAKYTDPEGEASGTIDSGEATFFSQNSNLRGTRSIEKGAYENEADFNGGRVFLDDKGRFQRFITANRKKHYKVSYSQPYNWGIFASEAKGAFQGRTHFITPFNDLSQTINSYLRHGAGYYILPVGFVSYIVDYNQTITDGVVSTDPDTIELPYYGLRKYPTQQSESSNTRVLAQPFTYDVTVGGKTYSVTWTNHYGFMIPCITDSALQAGNGSSHIVHDTPTSFADHPPAAMKLGRTHYASAWIKESGQPWVHRNQETASTDEIHPSVGTSKGQYDWNTRVGRKANWSGKITGSVTYTSEQTLTGPFAFVEVERVAADGEITVTQGANVVMNLEYSEETIVNEGLPDEFTIFDNLYSIDVSSVIGILTEWDATHRVGFKVTYTIDGSTTTTNAGGSYLTDQAWVPCALTTTPLQILRIDGGTNPAKSKAQVGCYLNFPSLETFDDPVGDVTFTLANKNEISCTGDRRIPTDYQPTGVNGNYLERVIRFRFAAQDETGQYRNSYVQNREEQYIGCELPEATTGVFQTTEVFNTTLPFKFPRKEFEYKVQCCCDITHFKLPQYALTDDFINIDESQSLKETLCQELTIAATLSYDTNADEVQENPPPATDTGGTPADPETGETGKITVTPEITDTRTGTSPDEGNTTVQATADLDGTGVNVTVSDNGDGTYDVEWDAIPSFFGATDKTFTINVTFGNDAEGATANNNDTATITYTITPTAATAPTLTIINIEENEI